ncbi:toxin-antitoxin system YwqK family antitoxin [Candidatus Omnitrophota bacterium]
MIGQTRARISGVALGFIMAVSIAAIFASRMWMRSVMQEEADLPQGQELVQQVSLVTQAVEEPQPKNTIDSQVEPIRKVLRKGGGYTENIFYQGNEEISREKIDVDGNITQKGKIPDGKVEFAYRERGTYGEEYYKWGKKHGPSYEYFDDGQVRIEAYYRLGVLQTVREYYSDGSLRLEADYRDARDYKINNESGEGKVYFSNGKVKYEWRFTKSYATGRRRTYNQTGKLRHEAYYDENGNVIKEKYHD